MTLYSTHPILDYANKINGYVQADIDIPSESYSGIGSVFSYTKNTGSAVSIDYRISDTPLPASAIEGDSFSTYFLGEQPYNPQLGLRIPILYSDIVVKGNVKDLTAMVDRATLIAISIEKLIMNNHPSLGGTCNSIMVTDIFPIIPDENLQALNFFGLTMKWEIFPMGINT